MWESGVTEKVFGRDGVSDPYASVSLDLILMEALEKSMQKQGKPNHAML